MNDIRIIFGASGVSFPDGTCLGVQGEHNAERLVLTLPPDMLEGVTHHVVRYQVAGKTLTSAPITEMINPEGARRDGNTLYVPLTKDVTSCLTLSLRVLAMSKVGTADAVLNSTETAQGLWFHAADGAGGQGLPDTHRQEEYFHMLAAHGRYEIDSLDELDTLPCSTIRQGERVYLRNMCLTHDYGVGLCPELNKTYRACFFPKDLQTAFCIFGDELMHAPASSSEAWYELLTLVRGNADSYRIQLYYHNLFGSYVLHVAPNTAATAEDSTQYYYVPKDCSFRVDNSSGYIGGNFTMSTGWNREYYEYDENRDARVCHFATCDPPPAFFDALCTQLTVDPPESFFDDTFSLLPLMICLNCTPETWAPKGFYVCHKDGQGVYLESGFRRIKFTIRADEDAWSNGCQTVEVPTATHSDIYSPVYRGEDGPYGKDLGVRYTPLSQYGIKVVEVGGGLLTVAKTSEYNLTEDTEFTGSLRRIYVRNTSEYYELDDHAHDYPDGGVMTTLPTCTTQGRWKRVCACGHEKFSPVPALGHAWGEWVVTTAPTSEADGVETRTCSRCGATETRAVEYTLNVIDNTPAEEEPPSIPPEYLDEEGTNDGE